MDRQGRRGARSRRSRRRGHIQGRTSRQSPGRVRTPTRTQGSGRRHRPPSRARSHLLRAQVRLARRFGRRGPSNRRGPRRGGTMHPRLDRVQCRRDPDEGPGDRPYGPRWWPGHGRRHLLPRHLAQSRSPTPHACGDRQHGSGRGRQMAHHGQREALRIQDADRGHVPERVGAGNDAPRLPCRENPMPTGASRSSACRARS